MASVINQIKFNDIEYAIAASAYAECSTAAGTAAKVATICTDGDTTNTGFALVKGVSVKVKFTVTNTASSPTLNINGTGAKAIMYRGSAINKGYLAANRVYEFVYDGTDWELVGDINTDTDTNTKVTSVGNHYTPSANSASQLSVDASSSTSATWGSTDLVTGVNIQRDAAGHVTGVTVDSIQMPSNPNSHNSHKINSGLKADNSTSIMSASASSGDITLGDSGVTAGEYGPTSNETPGYGATFNVPDIKINSKGIVTSVVNRTVKVPNKADVIVSQTTSSGINATHGGTVNVITNVAKGDINHEIDVTMTPITLPSETTLSKKADTAGTATTLTHGGKFKAVTDTTVNGHAITDVVTEFTLPSETKLSKANDSTGTKTLSYGGTFTAITDTTVNGHEITDTTITYTLPGVPTVSGTASYTLGGISKGTTYTNKSIVELLNDLLFPYIAPSISQFKLLKSNSTQNTIAEAEYGESISIPYITLTFNGSNSITSIKIGTTSGGYDLLNSTSAITSGTAIKLNTAWEPSTTNNTSTIYCSISDGTNTATKSTTFQRKYYNYSTVSSSATPPNSGLTKRTATGGEATYTYSANDYVWLYDRSDSKRIQQQDAGEWFDVAMAGPTQVTITLSSGASATYYAYRTSKMASSGSATYRLA